MRTGDIYEHAKKSTKVAIQDNYCFTIWWDWICKKKKKKVALKYKVEFEENLWSEYSVLSDDVNTSNCMKRGGTEDLLLFNTLVASSHVNQTTWCLVLSAKT